MKRILLSLTIAALALLSPLSALAQDAAGERVLRFWTSEVKLTDGSRALWTFTSSYNENTGEYFRTVKDASGALIERSVQSSSMARPTNEEIETARAIILADPELRRLFEMADNPVLSGGFILQREEGHPCGPGSRCLQFDMFSVDEAARRADRIRYVVVNIRDGQLISRDLDPTSESNATRLNSSSTTIN